MGNFRETFGNFLETVQVVIGQESVRVGMWSQKLHLDQKEAFLVNFSPQTLVLVPTATFAREITEYLRKINVRINDL